MFSHPLNRSTGTCRKCSEYRLFATCSSFPAKCVFSYCLIFGVHSRMHRRHEEVVHEQRREHDCKRSGSNACKPCTRHYGPEKEKQKRIRKKRLQQDRNRNASLTESNVRPTGRSKLLDNGSQLMHCGPLEKKR